MSIGRGEWGSPVKAIRFERYGAPDVLELRDVDLPAIGPDDVLVRVKAAAVNPNDVHFMRGEPYLVRLQAGMSRPKDNTIGHDLAGVVESVGAKVTSFTPGDEVFGWIRGTFAEYVSIPENGVLLVKPDNLTFEQAGCVAVAAFTALQALRDKGKVQPGHKVLVNGASGGVGTFAVQIAKALGAEVTAVCGTGNVELVRSIGADHVVDYTKDDFTATGERYDVLLDSAANRSLSDCRRALTPKGVLIGVGLASDGLWFGPLASPLAKLFVSPFVGQTLTPFLARESCDDFTVLRDLLQDGKVTPMIDRTYPLDEVPAAVAYLEEGHAKAKVAITV